MRATDTVSRRSVIGAAAAMAAEGPATAFAAEGASSASPKVRERVIDFRVRPPFRSLRKVFAGGAPGAKDPSDQDLMAKFIADMDAAGVDMGVAMGRIAPAPGLMQGTTSNDDVAALAETYPKRFVGFGAVDVRDPAKAVAEVDRCAKLGLKGIAFDNPLSQPPLHNDDEALLPVYERCAKNKLIISINASAMIGPDISYSDPARIQRVARHFPDHPVVVTHGAWPYTTQMVAVAMMGVLARTGRIYFQCDYGLMANVPGGRDYLDAANIQVPVPLYKNILFGSSYPALPLAEAVRQFNTYRFDIPEARARILAGNAAELLGV
jgi:predicted TIM-barrel fold metal-dependent hydrolase